MRPVFIRLQRLLRFLEYKVTEQRIWGTELGATQVAQLHKSINLVLKVVGKPSFSILLSLGRPFDSSLSYVFLVQSGPYEFTNTKIYEFSCFRHCPWMYRKARLDHSAFCIASV